MAREKRECWHKGCRSPRQRLLQRETAMRTTSKLSLTLFVTGLFVGCGSELGVDDSSSQELDAVTSENCECTNPTGKGHKDYTHSALQDDEGVAKIWAKVGARAGAGRAALEDAKANTPPCPEDCIELGWIELGCTLKEKRTLSGRGYSNNWMNACMLIHGDKEYCERLSQGPINKPVWWARAWAISTYNAKCTVERVCNPKITCGGGFEITTCSDDGFAYCPNTDGGYDEVECPAGEVVFCEDPQSAPSTEPVEPGNFGEQNAEFF